MIPPPIQLAELPICTSNALELVRATPEEAAITNILNASSWRGPLTFSAYLERERRLAATQIAQREGLTVWLLVDSKDRGSPRNILSACETLRKRALVAKPDGTVREVVTHGIGSVYCREEYRGRGYAGRMMRELGRVLEGWQQNGSDRGMFNVLYSDIGKQFYAKQGWKPFQSSHISLKPAQELVQQQGSTPVQDISDQDLDELCELDTTMLKIFLSQNPGTSPLTRLAFVPDADTMRWHHCRESFVAWEVLGRDPLIKGASTTTQNNKKVWCIWTRTFSENESENILHVLRFAAEDEPSIYSSDLTRKHGNTLGEAAVNENLVVAVANCLQAAQHEASKWNMRSVQVWNPSPTILEAARRIDPAVVIVDRSDDSIPSLLWYGQDDACREVEWVGNEKYGWC